MSKQCPKCGAERTIELPDGDDFECRTVTNGKGEILRIGDPCKIRELTRENADLKSQLAASMTMEQVCERLNSVQLTDIDCFDNLVERKGGFLLRCNLVAEEFGLEFDETKDGFSVFEPTL